MGPIKGQVTAVLPFLTLVAIKEKLQRMGQPTATRSLATGTFLAFVHLGLTVAALGPAKEFLARTTGSSLAAISSVFIAQNLGYMLGSFFGGGPQSPLR